MKKESVFVVATVLLNLFYNDFALAQDEEAVVKQEECPVVVTGTLEDCVETDFENDGDTDFMTIVDGLVRYFQMPNTGDLVEIPIRTTGVLTI